MAVQPVGADVTTGSLPAVVQGWIGSLIAAGIMSKADVSALAAHVARTDNPHATTKAQLGLGNVDNTSDANKPVSPAQQAAIQAAVDSLVGGVTPADRDTIRELATLLTGDEATLAAVVSGLATKAPVSTTTADLSDVTVTGLTGQLVAGVTSNVAGAGAYTSPALDPAVGTPPKRWAVKASKYGPCTITYPDSEGVVTTITILAGGARTFRQKSTLGWGSEIGVDPLGQLDGRYFTLSGAGAPDQALGVAGQVYVDTVGKVLYGPKAVVTAAGPFPTVTTPLDSFARPAETPLSSGGQWSGPIQTESLPLSLTSGAARPNTGATTQTFSSSYWNVAKWADVDVVAVVPTFAGQVNLWARVNGSGASLNGYNVSAQAAGTYNVHKLLGGVQTSLGSGSVAWANGDSVGLRVIGSTIKVMRLPAGGTDWATVATFTDTQVTAAGYVGLELLNAAPAAVSSFTAGPVVTTSTTAWTTSFPFGASFTTVVPAPTGVAATDTANIAAALATARAAGGGGVQLQAGQYVCNPGVLSVPSYTSLKGVGFGATTILQVAGSTGDLLTTDGFAAYTGSNAETGAAVNFTIEALTLDGNAANLTTGWPLRIAGAAYRLKGIRVIHGAAGGIWAEGNAANVAVGGNAGGLTPIREMEALWHDVRVTDYYAKAAGVQLPVGYGVYLTGSHDTQWSNVTVSTLAAVSGAGNIGTATIYGVYIGTGMTGLHADTVHIWGRNHHGVYIAASSHFFSNWEVEGAFTSNVTVAAGRVTWAGGTIYGTNSQAGQTTEVAITLGIAGSAVNGCQFTGVLFTQFVTPGALVAFTNENSGNVVKGLCIGASAPISGTPNALDIIEILNANTAGGGVFQRAGAARPVVQVFTATGPCPAVPGATSYRVDLVGGGGGGQAGGRQASGTISVGGASGAGGGYSSAVISAADWGTTQTITVGTGGAGGAATATDSTAGAPGTAGTFSQVGGFAIALGGNGGTAGTAATAGLGLNASGGTGVAATSTGLAAANSANAAGGGPGGAGGGITAAGAVAAGAKGGAGSVTQGTAGAAGAAGAAGGNGSARSTASIAGGGGGGGGGGAGLTGGFPGGNGGGYGSGGGGGGATQNGNPSGAGGNGMPGVAVVTAY